MDCHFRDLSLIVPRNSGNRLNPEKWQFIRNYSRHKNKKCSTKFDDLGVIIMRKRCSIQQGEKANCWSEQSPKKSTVSTVLFFWGPPGILWMNWIEYVWKKRKCLGSVQNACYTKIKPNSTGYWELVGNRWMLNFELIIVSNRNCIPKSISC